MNKAELVEVVASGAGVSKGEAEGVLDTFFETVQTSAKAGEKVGWPGFGKFSTRQRAARAGRNPQTGAAVKVKASTAMRFESSSVLKTFLNTKGRKAAAKKAAPAPTTAAGRSATGTSSSATRATSGRTTANSSPAKKATANGSPAKKATATKATTASKSAPSKAAASKAAPTKAAASKATPTKAAAAKKAPAKRSTGARTR